MVHSHRVPLVYYALIVISPLSKETTGENVLNGGGNVVCSGGNWLVFYSCGDLLIDRFGFV